MKLKMEMIPNSYEVDEKDYYFPSCKGKITIDDFWESTRPALNYWTTEDYERQWAEAVERIKTHDTSCFVSSVQNPHISNPLIDWWVMYKQGKKIVIQNELITSEDYEEIIGNNNFTPENCYQFIRPYETRPQEEIDAEENPALKCGYSEWVVYLDEIEHQA